MPPPPEKPVAADAEQQIARRIDERMRQDVAACSLGGPPAIARRIEQLDREWDVGRTLEMAAAAVATVSVALGFFGGKRWLLLAGLASGALAHCAATGGGPSLSIFRRFCLRTPREIGKERYALKALRGDFEGVHGEWHGREGDDFLAEHLERVDGALTAVRD